MTLALPACAAHVQIDAVTKPSIQRFIRFKLAVVALGFCMVAFSSLEPFAYFLHGKHSREGTIECSQKGCLDVLGRHGDAPK